MPSVQYSSLSFVYEHFVRFQLGKVVVPCFRLSSIASVAKMLAGASWRLLEK